MLKKHLVFSEKGGKFLEENSCSKLFQSLLNFYSFSKQCTWNCLITKHLLQELLNCLREAVKSSLQVRLWVAVLQSLNNHRMAEAVRDPCRSPLLKHRHGCLRSWPGNSPVPPRTAISPGTLCQCLLTPTIKKFFPLVQSEHLMFETVYA